MVVRGGPTDWHSVAASALGAASQKATDLAREAVNCNAMFGGAYLWTGLPLAASQSIFSISLLYHDHLM
jgi:hypothetical protein